MKTNRSLLVYILLSILTLGLYSLYFWSCFARDMNVVCVGDGRRTRGILARIIFGALTFGIYEIVWLYTTGDRIRINAHRLNVSVACTGSVLAWTILGALIVIGPFVAMCQMMSGLNQLCEAYNRSHYQGASANANANVNVNVNVNT